MKISFRVLILLNGSYSMSTGSELQSLPPDYRLSDSLGRRENRGSVKSRF